MTALALAERGILVGLFEKGRIAGEQSSRNWGWVRQIGRDAAELPLTIASLKLWAEMNSRICAETGFRRTGITYLCYDDADLGHWGAWYQKGRGCGLPMRMLDAREVAELLPGSDGTLRGGLFSPGAGRVATS